MLQFLTYLFIAIYTATVIGIILVVILGNRNPLKTIPWVVVLIFAPVVGLVFYFFFGQDLRRKRIISRRTYKRLMVYALPAHVRRSDAPVPAACQSLSTLLTNTSQAVSFYGSRLTHYGDGASKMTALLEEIEKARDHIHILYYIFCDDETGARLQQALIRKAKEGVKVRVLYDDVGCNGVKKEFFQQMRDAGAEVHALLHVRFPMLTDRVNYRNHRKIVVIDGRVGFFGGMNIADRYVKGPGWGVWRDSHFKVEGKGVYGLQSAFLVDWSTVERVHLDTSKFFPEADNYTSSTMQFATSGPLGPWRTLLQGIMTAIAGARRSICIQTPYFLPTEGLNPLLQTAALGGIDVQLMLPERSDSRIIDKAVHSFIDDMLRAGVKVYFYTFTLDVIGPPALYPGANQSMKINTLLITQFFINFVVFFSNCFRRKTFYILQSLCYQFLPVFVMLYHFDKATSNTINAIWIYKTSCIISHFMQYRNISGNNRSASCICLQYRHSKSFINGRETHYITSLIALDYLFIANIIKVFIINGRTFQ